jgi:exopolyphosphatase/pppGpp-phosphohydrolase
VRLGVLDVGSHTVHLLVVDAHRGAHPTPMTSDEPEPRLPDHLDALVAGGALRLPRLEICPWALREGVILRRLDTLDGTAQIDRSAQDAPERLGRLTTYEARCTG